MIGQIFIPLKKRDAIEEIISYLEVFARPGMQVVFLAPYKEEVSWMDVQLTVMQTGITSIVALKSIEADASRERQLRWVKKKIGFARQTLIRQGLMVAVECYSGSVWNAIASLRDSKTEMIIAYTNPHNFIDRLLSRAGKLLSDLGTPTARSSCYCALAVNIELNGILGGRHDTDTF